MQADGSTMLSRGELLAKIQRYAKGFQVNGLQPGDRVCIHIGDTVENYASMMGCVFAGASIVLAKTSLTARMYQSFMRLITK
ncbi:hypothetical protein HPB48_001587 [Haemaphysalis longicornis]|uniref:AMP-dependent synthetase/ligase domain-containing protein n=1 Tax=Haemaphysalis longicornis TaxID=44386 RepID=A0A9J6G9Y8_HAELO|nr:hypothetical protein HPB48_001587 [Haemaphysalis longicornis]